MTRLLLAALATAAVTVPVTWRITWRYGVRHGDIVTYDHQRDWRAIADQADHDHRTARRFARALTAFDDIHREIVGDLLDKLAARDRTIARLRRVIAKLRRPRHQRTGVYSPERFTYGRWRPAS